MRETVLVLAVLAMCFVDVYMSLNKAHAEVTALKNEVCHFYRFMWSGLI